MIEQIVKEIRADIEKKIDFMDKRLKDGLADIVTAVLTQNQQAIHMPYQKYCPEILNTKNTGTNTFGDI